MSDDTNPQSDLKAFLSSAADFEALEIQRRRELAREVEFAAEAHRQSLVIAQSEQESDDQAFIDAAIALWPE